MSDRTERNCNKCIHHTSGMCDSWNCKMQTVEDVKKEAVNEYVKAVVEELKVIKEDALAEYNIGEYNLDNNIGNSIAENYRKDMNEGKCFAYDEAIAMMHEWADYECYNEEQIQASEAFNQIAVLLEELKAYRTLDKTNFSDEYNRAIDDFMKSIRDIVFDYYTNEAYIKYDDLCKIAEQLKAGVKE